MSLCQSLLLASFILSLSSVT